MTVQQPEAVPDHQPDELISVTNGAHSFEVRRFQSSTNEVALLWLPALGVSARNYDRFARALASQNVSVLVPDYRGIGSSSLRASRAVDWQYEDVISDLLAIPTEHNCGTLVGGHSIGGQFATLLAAVNPERFAAVVHCATGIPYLGYYGWKALPFALFTAYVWSACKLFGYYPGRKLGFAGNESAGLMQNWLATIYRGGYTFASRDYEPLLDKVELPVCSIHLADDKLITESSAAALARTLGTETSKVNLSAADFEGASADHFSWLDEPDPVAKEIARFAADAA